MENFFTFKNFYRGIAAREGFRRFAEVGVWKGESINFLAQLVKDQPGVELYAVDLFEQTYTYRDSPLAAEIPTIHQTFEKTLIRGGTHHLIHGEKGRSHLVADRFEDAFFDFVFLDADHQYEQVLLDLKNWYPKVRSGGIFAGHDYWDYPQPDGSYGVSQAVDTFFEERALEVKLHAEEAVWMVEIP